MTLYLLQYNNYYNRLAKKERTLAGYTDKATILASFTGISFIPNDGITTTQIVNYTPAANEMPDYLLVVDEYGDIVSRWYVVGANRTRAGQYHLSLLRDLVADWYGDILNAPCFVEKAMLGINDPGIFNSENMTYNQIKTSETLIKDLTNSAWYVGYLNKTYATTNAITIPKGTDIIAGTYGTKEQYPYAQYTASGSANFITISDLTFKLYFRNHVGDSWVVGWDELGNPKTPTHGTNGEMFTGLAKLIERNRGFLSGEWTHTASELAQGVLDIVGIPVSVDWMTGVEATAGASGVKTESELASLLGEQGKIYQLGNDYYQVAITSKINDRMTWAFDNSSVAAQNYLSVARASGELDTSNINGKFSAFEANRVQYTVELIPYSLAEYEIEIPQDRNKTMDSPWDLFCVPYHAVKHGEMISSPDMSKRVVDALINNLTSDAADMYDIQLLPFCPLDDYLLDEGEILIGDMPNNGQTNYLQIGEGENNTLVVFCSSSNFKKRLTKTPLALPTDAIEFKVANECDVYRLVSPNYNGQFEFSITKNGGLTGYDISMSCKPYTPYIKVAPIFGRLYGEDFGDARGLICGGDFSLFRINSAWNEYELNNKNYQVMFDRQIQNMEVNNSVAREQEIVGAVVGTLGAGVTGYTAGSMIGYGGYGAAIATGLSAIGAVEDYRLNEKLRAEALDYTKDQFGYQLGNIKAIPNSLTKVSALNADNKLFPVLEFYTCSKTEKQALRDKITYNGMTVMRIGKLVDFVPRKNSTDTRYLKGQLIRLEELGAPYNIANAIANEINQGVFIKYEHSK